MATKIPSASTGISATHAWQIADGKQLTPQEIKALGPQIGDQVITSEGVEIKLDATNYAAFMASYKKDFFVAKEDGTIYFQNKNGIDILADAGKYTDNTDDDLNAIKYSPGAGDAFKAAMNGDGSKAQQKAVDSMAAFFKEQLGPVPTDAEAAKVLAKNLPAGYYTAEDLQVKYDKLKAQIAATIKNKDEPNPDDKALLSALGKVLYDHDSFNKIDGIRTNGVTDGSISTWGLATVGNETI